MLGNDVVDLRDPDANPESYRPRFDRRVFDPAELREIVRDPHPLARRWAHWAAKEAAYKLARQVAPDFVFAPAKLVVRYAPLAACASFTPDAGSGRVDGRPGDFRTRRGEIELPEPLGGGIRTLEIRAEESADYVHVVALPSGADWEAVAWAVEPLVGRSDGAASVDRGEAGAGDRSETERDQAKRAQRAVRVLARDRVARDLGIDAARIEIGRRGRIPTVEIDGARSTLGVSLSHHGNWIACATSLRFEEIPQSNVGTR